MYSRSVITALLFVVAASCANAGVIVGSDCDLAAKNAAVSSMIGPINESESPTAPWFQGWKQGDEGDGLGDLSGSIVGGTTFNVMLTSSMSVIAKPSLVGRLPVLNRLLPPPPNLDGLLKPPKTNRDDFSVICLV